MIPWKEILKTLIGAVVSYLQIPDISHENESGDNFNSSGRDNFDRIIRDFDPVPVRGRVKPHSRPSLAV